MLISFNSSKSCLYHVRWHHVRWNPTRVIVNEVSCGRDHNPATRMQPLHLWVQQDSICSSFSQVGGPAWLSSLQENVSRSDTGPLLQARPRNISSSCFPVPFPFCGLVGNAEAQEIGIFNTGVHRVPRDLGMELRESETFKYVFSLISIWNVAFPFIINVGNKAQYYEHNWPFYQ